MNTGFARLATPTYVAETIPSRQKNVNNMSLITATLARQIHIHKSE